MCCFLFTSHFFKGVNYSQSQVETIDDLIKNLILELPEISKHDHIAQSQAAYLKQLKNNFEGGELVLTLNFSENYSFHVQNAIQSQLLRKSSDITRLRD